MSNNRNSKSCEELKQKFIDTMVSRGWKLDRFGHLVKDIKVLYKNEPCILPHRFKLLGISLRFEVKLDRQWRLKSRGFYKEIVYAENGSIDVAGVRFKLKKVES